MKIEDVFIRKLVHSECEAHEAYFLEVQTDSNVSGIWGPIYGPQIHLIARLKSLVIGCDPLASEQLWRSLYSSESHGHTGYWIMLLGALDCALLDIRGKYLGCPVHALFGGPVRSMVSSYATMLGYDPDEMLALERAKEVTSMGFLGQKWGLRDTHEQGLEGLSRNVERVFKLREILGNKNQLMIDALGNWNYDFAASFCKGIEGANICWLEEPLAPGLNHRLKDLRSRFQRVPIAAGEHLYTRYQVFQLLNDNAIDYLQPDVVWCGGLSEAIKIAAISSVYDIPVIPHGQGLIGALHLAACCHNVAMVEYHMTWEEKRQFFYKTKYIPQNGHIKIPDAPGIGIEIDTDKVSDSLVIC